MKYHLLLQLNKTVTECIKNHCMRMSYKAIELGEDKGGAEQDCIDLFLAFYC